MKNYKGICGTLLAIGFLFNIPAMATTRRVPSQYPSIQAAINASINRDTVLVSPGAYEENINLNGRNIVLGSLYITTRDTSYILSTIIDGDSAGTVIALFSGEDTTCLISGFTIRYGYGGYGGGIHCSNANPRIVKNIIQYNSVLHGTGAGIYCFQSNPLIANNVITNNYASGDNSYGGGIAGESSDPKITNNTIIGNESQWDGAGIYFIESSAPLISDNIIANNYSFYGSGGGIYCGNRCEPTIIRNTITGNLGGNQNAGGTKGGGICCYSLYNYGHLVITNNIINYNTGNNEGGGIYSFNYEGTIDSNVIDFNTAFGRGGGIFCYESDLMIKNNQISNNLGSGINCTYSRSTISGNTVTGNSVSPGSAYYDGGGIISDAFSAAIIKENIVTDNMASRFGGGISVYRDVPITDNIIIGNIATDSGGGIYARSNDSLISNNVIAANHSRIGGGIACRESNPRIINNVFCNNTADSGPGICCGLGSHPLIQNCIIRGNISYPPGRQMLINDSLSVQVTFCNIQGGWTGQGNIDTSAFFRDTANYDYHLMSIPCGDPDNSPCIDKGSSLLIDSLLDCDRGLGSYRCDMGAFGGGKPSGRLIMIPRDYPTIQQGLNASAEYDTILVAPGIYRETAYMGNRRVLASGFLISGDPVYINTTIIEAPGNYTPISIYGSNDSYTSLIGFTVRDGNGQNAGAIACVNSNPTLSNNLIINNRSRNCGGGLYCRASSPRLNHITMYGNSAANLGGGIFCADSSCPIIENSIIWGNSDTSNNEILADSLSAVAVSYSDIRYGWNGVGNLNADPLFINPDSGDFQLMEESPCIDAGNPISPLDPDSSRADMGALYRYHISIVESNTELPTSIQLHQNYPNPFNAHTTFRYFLPGPADISISIYDILGREIAEFNEGRRQSGYHNFTLNASNLTSGIYFYKLETGDYTLTRKMILVK